MRKNGIFRRSLSLLLCAVLLFGTLAVTASAEPSTLNEDYKDGVIDRLDNYFTVDNLQKWSCDNGQFYSASMQALINDSMGASAYTWATQYLTDNELDENYYVEVLAEILAMEQNGMADTLAAQAAYDTESDKLAEVLDLGRTTVGAIVDAFAGDEISDAVSTVNLSIDIEGLKSNVVETEEQAAVLQVYNDVYAQQKLTLETIAANTDIKALKKACEYMQETCAAQLLYVCDSYYLDIFSAGKDCYSLLKGYISPKAAKVLSETGTTVQTGLAAWVRAHKGTVIKGLSAFAEKLSAVKTGFDIGGGIVNLVMGDEIRDYREIEALYNIGNALAPGFSSAVEAARKTGASDDDRYDAAFRMVTLGETLCYVRIESEELYQETSKWWANNTEESTEGILNNLEQLKQEYGRLSVIFPDDNIQVVVLAEEHVYSGTNCKSTYTKPVITVVNHQNITDKITDGSALAAMQTRFDDNAAVVQEEAEASAAYSPEDYFYTLSLRSAYCAGKALSLGMSESLYTGGAHPTSGSFAVTYDITTGEQLTLEDVLNPDVADARTQLQALFNAALTQVYADVRGAKLVIPNGEQDITDALGETGDLVSWYFCKDGICIHFAPSYEASSVGADAVDVIVSYDDASPYLNPDYVPEPHASGVEPVLVDTDTLTAEERALCTLYGDSDCGWFVLKTTETAYDVTGSIGFAIEYSGYPTSLVTGTDFYANYLTSSDLVFFDPFPDYNSYAGGIGISFRTVGTGNESRYTCCWYTNDGTGIEVDEKNYSYDFPDN